jgi:hypothetical protein
VSNYATRQKGNGHDRRCSEPGCTSKNHARGVCQKHYNLHYHPSKNGEPRIEGLIRPTGIQKGWGVRV